MNKLIVVTAAVSVAALSGCNPIEGFCKKKFECQEELGLTLDDDFSAVCEAQQEGEQNVLRASAEPECADLADAKLALLTCQNLLSCEDLKKLEDGDDGLCATERENVQKAQEATVENGNNRCDGIGVPPAEGEGEGEGE